MMNKKYTLLICLVLVFFGCIKKTHKRVTVEGHYYNGSTGEILSNKDVFLNERIDRSNSGKSDRCYGFKDRNIDATKTNSEGYFCFYWKRLSGGRCWYNTVDFQGLSDSTKNDRGVSVDIGEKTFKLDYHRIFSGGIKLKFKNFSFTTDSIELTITHVGHSAAKNLRGFSEATYSVSSSGGFDNLSNALYFNSTAGEITADYYGMGTYSYSIKAKRKSDGFKVEVNQTVFVNENEIKEIDI
jgi:hypothetical protein